MQMIFVKKLCRKFKGWFQILEPVVVQWTLLICSVLLVYMSAMLAEVNAIAGGLTNQLIGAAFVIMAGAYIAKIRRITTNVRYMKGVIVRTGDGGMDYASVLVYKGWIPFLKRPFDHFRCKFQGVEVTIDMDGYSAGCLRYNEHPVSSSSTNFLAIGDRDVVENQDALVFFKGLNRKRDLVPIIEFRHGTTMTYEQYLKWFKSHNKGGVDQLTVELTRESYYKWLGLNILERDGLLFRS